MSAFSIDVKTLCVGGKPATLFHVGFVGSAHNDEIVRMAEARMEEIGGLDGELALIYGPASLPVMVVLAHHLTHRFGAVGVFDPKLAAYVVTTSCEAAYSVGDLLQDE
jgi:CRISPR-associated protein Csx3